MRTQRGVLTREVSNSLIALQKLRVRVSQFCFEPSDGIGIVLHGSIPWSRRRAVR